MKITFNVKGYIDRRTLLQRWLGSSIQRKRTVLRRSRPDLQPKRLYGKAP